jgi:adenylosuccinate lyase
VQELSQRATQDGTFLRELLGQDERVRAADIDLATIFDPEHYTRFAEEIVGRLETLAGHARQPA